MQDQMIFDNVTKSHKEEKIVSSINGLEKLDIHTQKNKVGPFTPHISHKRIEKSKQVLKLVYFYKKKKHREKR